MVTVSGPQVLVRVPGEIFEHKTGIILKYWSAIPALNEKITTSTCTFKAQQNTVPRRLQYRYHHDEGFAAEIRKKRAALKLLRIAVFHFRLIFPAPLSWYLRVARTLVR